MCGPNPGGMARLRIGKTYTSRCATKGDGEGKALMGKCENTTHQFIISCQVYVHSRNVVEMNEFLLQECMQYRIVA